MVSSVRHLEHPEIPYLNTSSPKTSYAYQELNFFIFKCGDFHTITAFYLPLVWKTADLRKGRSFVFTGTGYLVTESVDQ